MSWESQFGLNTREQEILECLYRGLTTRGNGMLGIHIHNMKDANGKTDTKGKNPFDSWHVERDGKKTYFSTLYPSYDWVNDDGRKNMGIEAAAKKAGK